MPRPRVTEIAQRQSPRGPPSLRTSSSDSDQQHPRPRIPKATDGRSIRRATQSDSSNQNELGTRIANLESQLGLAQVELKSLKYQLVEKPKNHIEEKHSSLVETDSLNEVDSSITFETRTDVSKVHVERSPVQSKTEDDEDEMKSKSESEKPLPDELAVKNDKISLLKANVGEKDKELEIFLQENKSLRSQLDEKSLRIEELTTRLADMSQELEKSKANGVEMNKKLECSEKAKEDLENEMKRVRVQSDQWRKAADAAASILAGGMEINGRRLSERCGSMDKVYMKPFEHVGYMEAPGLVDDVFRGETRKGSGIRMFGELWKKKGQK